MKYPGWVYDSRLIFVSARTNKRHHHHQIADIVHACVFDTHMHTHMHTQVVISKDFIFFSPCNHIINIKKESFSGEVKEIVNFTSQ